MIFHLPHNSRRHTQKLAPIKCTWSTTILHRPINCRYLPTATLQMRHHIIKTSRYTETSFPFISLMTLNRSRFLTFFCSSLFTSNQSNKPEMLLSSQPPMMNQQSAGVIVKHDASMKSAPIQVSMADKIRKTVRFSQEHLYNIYLHSITHRVIHSSFIVLLSCFFRRPRAINVDHTGYGNATSISVTAAAGQATSNGPVQEDSNGSGQCSAYERSTNRIVGQNYFALILSAHIRLN